MIREVWSKKKEKEIPEVKTFLHKREEQMVTFKSFKRTLVDYSLM